MNGKVFKSAVDGWFYAVIVVAVLTSLAVLVVVIRAGSFVGIIAVSVTFLLALVLPLWILVSTQYEVDSTELRIYSGPFHWRIPLEQISSVSPSRSLLSSPALSLERLEIRYSGNKIILVSPEDGESFIAALGIKDRKSVDKQGDGES